MLDYCQIVALYQLPRPDCEVSISYGWGLILLREVAKEVI